ncbi:hypothetical protein B7486_19755 [cyanobacterium TDX16]|nr:hypothetical protein B7486_19755 [cyanobacterium TDX16]
MSSPQQLHAQTDPQAALVEFCSQFLGKDVDLSGATVVTSAEMPRVYRRLLVHNEHMTETLRAHHGEDVRLNVIKFETTPPIYRRYISLFLPEGDRVVELGMMKIDLRYATQDVRQQIVAQSAPLGELLVKARVMRRIEPKWYYRFDRTCKFLDDFGDDQMTEAYGRLATIFCDNAPAIELLEVVTDRWIREA